MTLGDASGSRPAPMVVEPITLEGRQVRLEPMSIEHLEALGAAGLGADVFRWYIDPVDTPARMRAWVELAVRNQAAGTDLPFTTVERATGRVIGSSRFLNIDRTHHRLEIGSTWITPGLQGAGYNSEAKLLQLDHAFGPLGAIRVEFKTDSLNERSRGALLGIGARFEGIFRNHMICHDGRYRHSAYYAITADEWPDVRRGLEQRLTRQVASAPGMLRSPQRTSTTR